MENSNKKPEERFVNHKSMIVKSEEGNDFLKRKELEEMRISCVYGTSTAKIFIASISSTVTAPILFFENSQYLKENGSS